MLLLMVVLVILVQGRGRIRRNMIGDIILPSIVLLNCAELWKK